MHPHSLRRHTKKMKELEKGRSNVGVTGDANTNIIPTPKKVTEDIDPALAGTRNKLGILSDSNQKVINILTTVILFILMRILMVIRRRNKLLKSKRILPLYNNYMYRLATIGNVKPHYQGDLEFAEEITNFDLKEKMKVLVKGSYEEIYSNHSVGALNNSEYYKFLEMYLKDYEGRLKYLLNKYLG